MNKNESEGSGKLSGFWRNELGDFMKEITNMELKTKEKIAYGLGAVGKDMVYMLSASYILYYYQDLLGVSSVAMGIILMAARIFDAFNDPIMGTIVAKTKTKWENSVRGF